MTPSCVPSRCSIAMRWAIRTRTRIRNVLRNLNEPAAAANSLLQGRPLEFAQTTLRFVFNSTAGIGGMFDLAQFGGPPRVKRDFGETLYVWGLPDGPYLMVPVLGPSNPRELTGTITNGFLNPLNYFIPLGPNLGRSVVEGVDERAAEHRGAGRIARQLARFLMPGCAACGSSTGMRNWADLVPGSRRAGGPGRRAGPLRREATASRRLRVRRSAGPPPSSGCPCARPAPPPPRPAASRAKAQ